MNSSNFSNPNPMFQGRLEENDLRIKIIGVGGAGNNAVDRLKLENLTQVHLAVVTTDCKTLSASPIGEKLQIGRTVTRGLSAGGEMETGRLAAESDRESLKRLVDGVDLVFLLAGLGGGTGSGASPVLAEVAEESGAVVIAFVTQPFTLEGTRRVRQAEDSLALLRRHCHAVIPLPNDILLQQIEEGATLLDAFALADEWISRGVRAIWSMLFANGLMNVDFGTLRAAFDRRGAKTLFGIGSGQGEDCVRDALRDLELCPLLHLPENKFVRKADSLIVNIHTSPDVSMTCLHDILGKLTEKFCSSENTVLGAVIDDNLQRTVRICVLGVTDLDGTSLSRQYRSGRSAARSRPASDHSPVAAASSGGAAEPRQAESRPGAGAGIRGASVGKPVQQEEFAFLDTADDRGWFGKTEKNLHAGEDLDVPTFIRKGVRIQFQVG